MGIDLRLLIVDGQMAACGFCHSMVSLKRDSRLFNAIILQPSEAVPLNYKLSAFCGAFVPDGSSKDETCYGEVGNDMYGDRLHWIRAEHLAKAFDTIDAMDWKNEAARGYIEALPPAVLIVLYWH